LRQLIEHPFEMASSAGHDAATFAEVGAQAPQRLIQEFPL